MEGAGAATASSVTSPPQPAAELPRPRRKWLGRTVMGTLGTVAVTCFYQFNYARKAPVWRDAMFMVDEELVPEVTAVTGALARYPWWDVRGYTLTWEWRPRIWFRRLVADEELRHGHEYEGFTAFRLHGELRDVTVTARAQMREPQQWQLYQLRVEVDDGPSFEIVKGRVAKLPDYMLRLAGRK